MRVPDPEFERLLAEYTAFVKFDARRVYDKDFAAKVGEDTDDDSDPSEEWFDLLRDSYYAEQAARDKYRDKLEELAEKYWDSFDEADQAWFANL